MFGIISKDIAKDLGIIFLSLNFIVFIIQVIKYKKLENAFLTLTGFLIFIPAFFVSKTIRALLAGVTMHYSQYIAITLKVFLSKNNINLIDYNNLTKNIFKIKGYLIWIISYGLVATSLTFFGRISDSFFFFSIF
tara:strand:+ start:327 stop:731 length:405 start_codon:yes stop_codon:yes gene_type:complete